DVIARLRNTAEHFAAASGATATLEVAGNAPSTSNDPALLERLRPSLEAAAGQGNVVEVPRYTIAEDFSQFANVVPGLYFFVGTTPRGQPLESAPMNHSPQYAPDESALDLVLRAMLQATVEFLGGGGGLQPQPLAQRMRRIGQQAQRQRDRHHHQQRPDHARALTHGEMRAQARAD